jgi:hypothetical protein
MPGLMAAAPFRIENDNGAWLNAAGDHAPGSGYAGPSAGMDVEMTPCMALEDAWI